MKTTQVTLRKIPLDQLIDSLIDIFDMGADYIDIIGIPGELNDTVAIAVKDEYYEPYEEEEEEEGYFPLTEEQLNELI